MKNFKLVLFALSLVSGMLFAGQYSLNTTRDTSLIQSNPLGNYGGSQINSLGMNHGGQPAYLLLKFEDLNFSPGEEVESAIINLYTGGSIIPANQYIQVFRVTRDWSEGTSTDGSQTLGGASWINARNETGEAWTNPGGDFVGVDGQQAQNAYYQTADFDFFNIYLDITDMVRGWQNGENPDYGVALVLHDYSNPTPGLFSKDLVPGLTRLDVETSSCEDDYCGLGDIVGVTQNGTTFVYNTVQDATGSVIFDNLEKIVICAGSYDENPTLSQGANVSISACGNVTLRGFTFATTQNVVLNGFNFDGDGISVGFGQPYVNDNLTISNCTIDNAGIGVFVQADNRNITVRNCSIGNNYNGVLLDVRGGPYNLINNEIHNSQNQGVVAGGSTVVLLEGNTIRDNAYFGIVREEGGHATNITLIENIFSGNGGFTVPGTHDENLGNLHLILDSTDQQPGY